MKILALEFSSDRRSVAVVSGDRLEEAVAAGRPAERTTQAFALVEAALRKADTTREEIECLAVGIGPGSYAGIRVAIAVAQGWQLARGVKLLGVSSVEAVAAQTREDGLRGRVQVAIDAQRNEVYLATFEIDAKEFREISPLRLAPRAVVESLAARGDVVIGPPLAQAGSPGRTVFPTARQIALLAVGRADFVAGEDLAPIYLRAAAFVKAPPPRNV